MSAETITSKPATGRRVRAALRTEDRDGRVSLMVEIGVEPDWHVYAPGSDDGLPVSLTVPAESALRLNDVRFPETADRHLSGTFTIEADIDTLPSHGTIHLRTQACSGQTCEAPEHLLLSWADATTKEAR